MGEYTPPPAPSRPVDCGSEPSESSGSGAQEHAERGDGGGAAEQERGGIRGTWRGLQRLGPGSGVCAGKGAASLSGRPSLAPGSPPANRPGLAARLAQL